ncbi:MAG: hypothetical protein ACFBWO_06175 [Paracoccaceae bacterium]
MPIVLVAGVLFGPVELLPTAFPSRAAGQTVGFAILMVLLRPQGIMGRRRLARAIGRRWRGSPKRSGDLAAV